MARSSEFGPSNGYGAGFPSQWISSDGRRLWLKWAANFDGCESRLDCSGKYGFNLARVDLTLAPYPRPAQAAHPKHRTEIAERVRTGVAYALSASALLLVVIVVWRRRLRSI